MYTRAADESNTTHLKTQRRGFGPEGKLVGSAEELVCSSAEVGQFPARAPCAGRLGALRRDPDEP